MNKPISVGDLVQIVRACCAESEDWIGITFLAAAPVRTTRECSGCGKLHPGAAFYRTESDQHFSAWRLKRIPPLEELEGEKQKEDMREPA